jgi:hypothetical protein
LTATTIQTDREMENKERLIGYLKELPMEKPSDDFTLQLMNRVRLEPVYTKMVYVPLIGRQVWWSIFIGFALVFLSTLFYFSFLPADSAMNGWIIFEKFDFTLITRPFELFSQALSKMSFTYIIIVAAIAVLLLMDQLYTLYTDR